MPTPPRDPPPLPSRFYSLDVLRGFAALSVVCYHWRHFLLTKEAGGNFDPALAAQQPFFQILRPFYTEGWRAVDLFFGLSGFIFTWLYAAPIRQRKISAWTFGVLRFSRLYPLHLATLLLVLVLQTLITRQTGGPFVYPLNDAYYFVLNLFFASSWGLEAGQSFNGPSWSVSVEIILYAVFFVTCFLGFHKWWSLLALFFLSVIGYALGMHPEVARGLNSFFLGCLSFHIFKAVHERRPPRAAIIALSLTCAGVWIAVGLIWYTHALTGWFQSYVAAHPFAGRHGLPRIVQMFETHAIFDFVAFPLTVVTLALVEAHRGSLGKRIAFVGDVSYSSYLLHFPLQAAVFLGVSYAGWSTQVFLHPATFILFFAALVGLSLLSFHAFERPMQSLIRRRVLGSAKSRGG